VIGAIHQGFATVSIPIPGSTGLDQADTDSLQNAGLTPSDVSDLVTGIGVQVPDSTHATSEVSGFTYDLAHYVNDVNTAYPQIVAQYGAGGSLTADFTYGVGRLDATGNGDTAGWLTGTGSAGATATGWYLPDGRSSVAQVATTAGDVVSQPMLDPWGTDAATNPGWEGPTFGFNGELSDPGTGLQYLRSRWYEPTSGRFVSQDSVIGSVGDPASFNRYTYALSDPVNRMDPGGRLSVPYQVPAPQPPSRAVGRGSDQASTPVAKVSNGVSAATGVAGVMARQTTAQNGPTAGTGSGSTTGYAAQIIQQATARLQAIACAPTGKTPSSNPGNATMAAPGYSHPCRFFIGILPPDPFCTPGEVGLLTAQDIAMIAGMVAGLLVGLVCEVGTTGLGSIGCAELAGAVGGAVGGGVGYYLTAKDDGDFTWGGLAASVGVGALVGASFGGLLAVPGTLFGSDIGSALGAETGSELGGDAGSDIGADVGSEVGGDLGPDIGGGVAASKPGLPDTPLPNDTFTPTTPDGPVTLSGPVSPAGSTVDAPVETPQPCSFTAGTPVLLADGSTLAIGAISAGVAVTATDPGTGVTSTQTVTAVWPHQEKVWDLTLADSRLIHTTTNQP